jgi:hypothetical protein
MERECLKSHNIHLVIHYDPIVTDDPELSRLHALVDQLLTDINPELHTHDFRIVRAKDFTNLIFDVTLPEHLKKEEKSIKHQLDEKLSLLEETTYYTVITFDQPAFNQNCSGN